MRPLHAGLIILIPNVARSEQRELFRVALDELAVSGEPINQALEVYIEENEVKLITYELHGGTQ